MNKEKRQVIFSKLASSIDNPTTELKYSSGFELLVAVILSAQATDISVNIATQKLFKEANTPTQLIKIGEHRLKKYIKTIGLYNSKAKNIVLMSQQLLDNFNGKIPNNRKDLQSLAGVGRKTANVILNTLFGQATIAVDTHLFRLANRIGLAKGKNELQVELGLLKHTPQKYLPIAHHLLILHGRYVCMAKKPKCGECIIYAECEFKKKAN